MTSLREVLNKANGVANPPTLDRDQIFADYYVPKHKAWYQRTEKDRRWSQDALTHNHRVYSGYYKHGRDGRISPSSIGTDCERELLFGFIQAPQIPASARSEEVMDAGTSDHVRHQMVGLSAGHIKSLDDVEVWVHSDKLRCGGSADARLEDGSLFELKNTASHLFDAIAKGPNHLGAALERERREGKGSAAAYAAKMVLKAKLQMRTYSYVDKVSAAEQGREPLFGPYGSLVYQQKESKDLYEFRIRIDVHHEAVAAILDSALGWVDLNELPDMHESCARVLTGGASDKDSRRFNSCFYREHCPKAGSVLR